MQDSWHSTLHIRPNLSAIKLTEQKSDKQQIVTRFQASLFDPLLFLEKQLLALSLSLSPNTYCKAFIYTRCFWEGNWEVKLLIGVRDE